MWNRNFRISTPSCPVASPTRVTASRVLPISAISWPWRTSTSRCGRPSRRCSALRTRACRKRQFELFSRRGALRRNVELAGDVTALLRQPAKTIGIAADFVDVEVTLVVQRPEQLAHALEHGREIGGLFILGVGALGDMDVEPIAGEPLLRERFAAGEPVRRVDRLDDDGGDLRILVQDVGGEFGDGGRDVGLQRWSLARTRISDGDEGHDLSPCGVAQRNCVNPKLDLPPSFW